MKIEVTANQAKIMLETLSNELWQVQNGIAPQNRKQARMSLIKESINNLSVNLLKNGVIDQAYFNAIYCK